MKLVVLTLLFTALPGCTHGYFRKHPTPENFVADAAEGSVAVAAAAVILPVLAVTVVTSSVADAIHTDPPCRTCEASAPCAAHAECTVPRPRRAERAVPLAPRTLPAEYRPGWERAGTVAVALPPGY